MGSVNILSTSNIYIRTFEKIKQLVILQSNIDCHSAHTERKSLSTLIAGEVQRCIIDNVFDTCFHTNFPLFSLKYTSTADQLFHSLYKWRVVSHHCRRRAAQLSQLYHLCLIDVGSISTHDKIHAELVNSPSVLPTFPKAVNFHVPVTAI